MKKIIALLFVMLLAVSGFAGLTLSAYADAVEYPLWVNSEQITSEHLTVQCGEGTATFDPSTATLTLDNAEITKGVPKNWLYTGILSYLPSVTIVVNGNCTITKTGGDGIGSYNSDLIQVDDVYYATPYDITVCGDGSLTIEEDTRLYGYGFYCTGKLVIDGVKLNITSAATGVWATDLEMRGTQADIHCTTQFSGIVVNRGEFTFAGSTVNAVSDQGAGLLLGTDKVPSNLTMNSGSLGLKGVIGVQSIVADSTITVNGGVLTAEGTEKAFDDALQADNGKNIIMGEGVSVTSGAIDGLNCVIEGASSQTGVTVSGAITSYLDDSDVTVKLTGKDNNFIGENTGKTAYTITNVLAGTYELTVSKNKHVTRTYELTVGTEDVAYDVTICPIGDANLSGVVDMRDYAAAYKHVMKTKLLTGYALDCADVNRKGGVDMKDYAAIYKHVMKTKMLW